MVQSTSSISGLMLLGLKKVTRVHEVASWHSQSQVQGGDPLPPSKGQAGARPTPSPLGPYRALTHSAALTGSIRIDAEGGTLVLM